MAELKEIKAYHNIYATGTIIESKTDKQKGNLATLLIKNGTLKVGDQLIIDDLLTKVKVLINDKQQRIQEAIPGMPVEIIGIGRAVDIGANFVVVNDDKNATKVVQTIIENKTKAKRKKTNFSEVDINDLFIKGKEEAKKELNVILKADNLAVLEAIASKLTNMSSKDVNVKILHKDVGEITNSDLLLAEASKALIYLFNLKTNDQIKQQAASKSIKIKTFNIIYKLFEDLEELVNASKKKEFKEEKIGEVEVKALFEFSKIGKIAGCYVRSGKVTRNAIAKVLRANKEIAKSTIESLKFQKENIKETTHGHECGIVLKDFLDYQVDDLFEIYELVEVK